MTIRGIAPGLIEDALNCLSRKGFSVEPVLQATGLSAADARSLTPQQIGQVWIAVADLMDDEFLGLSARPMYRGSYALMCHAAWHAGTLGRALKRALQFLRIVLGEPHGELVVADGWARIVLSGADGTYQALAYRTYWLIVLGLACCLIGRRIPVQRINFACAHPERRVDYDEFFGIPVHFDQESSYLAFDAALLQLPTVRSEQALKTFLRGAPGNLLVSYCQDAGWVMKLRAYLKSVPLAEWPDFDMVAQALAVAPTTLRRHLRSEGQNFALIKEEMRKGRAQFLLRESALGVAEIARELGFTEPSAFHRAFRAWTGTSPAAFRRGNRKS
jgi:AraC-like DNA-binding protein